MQDAAHGVPPHRHQFEAESLSLLGGEEQIGEEPQPPHLFMENPRAAASWDGDERGWRSCSPARGWVHTNPKEEEEEELPPWRPPEGDLFSGGKGGGGSGSAFSGEAAGRREMGEREVSRDSRQAHLCQTS